MEYLFKALFGKAAVAGISAILAFAPPSIIRNGNRIIVEGNLKGAITPKVKRILKTGTEIKIKFHISIIAHKKDGEKLLTKKIINSIIFNPLNDRYTVKLDGVEKTASGIVEAERLLGLYRADFLYSGIHSERFDYYIEAGIDYNSTLDIELPGQALWNYYIPSKKIKGIKIEAKR